MTCFGFAFNASYINTTLGKLFGELWELGKATPNAKEPASPLKEAWKALIGLESTVVKFDFRKRPVWENITKSFVFWDPSLGKSDPGKGSRSRTLGSFPKLPNFPGAGKGLARQLISY